MTDAAPERTRVHVGDVTLPAVDVWDFDGKDWVAFHVCGEDIIACRRIPAGESLPVRAPGFDVPPVRAALEFVQFEERTVTLHFEILDTDVDTEPADGEVPRRRAGHDREGFVYEEVGE